MKEWIVKEENAGDILRGEGVIVCEIVRCKDCKYACLTYDGEVKYCDIWFPDEEEYFDGDSFCSQAERRNSGEN